MKLKFTQDYSTKEAEPQTFKKDQVVDFPDDEAGLASARHYLNRRVAEEYTKATKTAAEDSEVASPVADITAEDAKTKISTMRSKENLQAIVEHDGRVTVQEAAKKRLEELNKDGGVQHMVPGDKR